MSYTNGPLSKSPAVVEPPTLLEHASSSSPPSRTTACQPPEFAPLLAEVAESQRETKQSSGTATQSGRNAFSPGSMPRGSQQGQQTQPAAPLEPLQLCPPSALFAKCTIEQRPSTKQGDDLRKLNKYQVSSSKEQDLPTSKFSSWRYSTRQKFSKQLDVENGVQQACCGSPLQMRGVQSISLQAKVIHRKKKNSRKNESPEEPVQELVFSEEALGEKLLKHNSPFYDLHKLGNEQWIRSSLSHHHQHRHLQTLFVEQPLCGKTEVSKDSSSPRQASPSWTKA